MDRPNGDHFNHYSRDALSDVIDGFSDVTDQNYLSGHVRSLHVQDALTTSLYDDVDDDVRSEEEQVRQMTFPDDAGLSVPLPSGSSTTSDDVSTTPDDVIRQLDSMLLPHTDDIILQERPLEEPTEDSPARAKVKEKVKEKVKRDKANPRSQLGVFALQLENMPDEMKKLSKSHRDRIQSLRKPGEINPRQFEDIELNVKKTRTFREMLFGTKSRAKMKDQVAIVPRTKTRQPLTNLGFTDNKAGNRGSAASLDLNLEEGGGKGGGGTGSFVRGLGSQMMLQDVVSQPSTVRLVSERARKLLTEDEVLAVTRHITRYEARGDIEALVTPLLAIFDSREKMTLLSDVRRLIKPTDVGRFDSMVSKGEFDAYEELAAETGTTSLMEQREQEIVPPKKTLMASVPDSHGTFKLKKHEEYKVMQDKMNQVEKDHRERLAKLAREKRQSLTDGELAFPHLPFAEHKQKEVVKNGSPSARHTLEILRPKSNSKVYKAIKVAVANELNGQETKDQTHAIEVNGETRVERGFVNDVHTEGNGFGSSHAEASYLSSEMHTSSPLSSRRSSVSSSGVNGMYSVNDRTYSGNMRSLSHPDLYSVSSIDAGSELNDSSASSKHRSVSEIRQYRSAEDSQGENVVVLISKSKLGEGINSEKPNDSIQAALEMLDGLEEGEDASSPQASPRSVASVSTIASTRYGSYDVQPALESSGTEPGDLSPRTPPVFVPPPPPSEPPPAGEDQEGSWSEWVTEYVTDEVFNTSSVGVASSSQAVMKDKAVGQTPRQSLVSVRSSLNGSEVSKEENLSNSNGNIENDYTLDYFNGSQNDTSALSSFGLNGSSEHHETHFTRTENSTSNYLNSSENVNISTHRSASEQRQAKHFTKGSDEVPPQVNSLRDTLRARRKSADRPRLSTDAFVFPEHLLVPNWGRMAQADNQQEEVVLDQQTVEYCDPPREPPQSPTRTQQEPIYAVPDLSHRQTSPELHRSPRGGLSGSPSGLEDLVETTPGRMAPLGGGPAQSVSASEVETFMSRSETRGDLYNQQQQALESVIYAKPAEQDVDVTIEEPRLIILSKTSSSLGISISGGRNSRTQPQVKIEKVIPGGAAAKEGTLQAGMRLMAVDSRSLANVTHRQAVEIIRRSYHNKKQPEMELLVLP